MLYVLLESRLSQAVLLQSVATFSSTRIFQAFLLLVLLLLAPSHDLLQLWWLRKQNNLQRDPC